jgi:hypothetical protein
VTFSAYVARRERLHFWLVNRRPTLRLLAFLVIAAFIIVGPFYEQVLGQSNPVFRSWRMYSTRGLGVIDAKFYAVAENGELRRIDRFALLDSRPGRKFRRIRTRKALESTISRLCRVVGEGADIRVIARRGTRKGWEEVDRGERNACAVAGS